jgi:hypothetical protein
MGVVVPDMRDAAHRKLKIQNSKFEEEGLESGVVIFSELLRIGA